jgi:four helix bundle protein
MFDVGRSMFDVRRTSVLIPRYEARAPDTKENCGSLTNKNKSELRTAHWNGNQRKEDPDMGQRQYDLEDRLLDYGAAIIRLVETLPRNRASNHVGAQLLRSGTSPLFNHGEAQAAESPNDFVHKMKVCLKELRESERALRLVQTVPLTKDAEEIEGLLKETDELIRIFVASIRTAENNKAKENTAAEYKI